MIVGEGKESARPLLGWEFIRQFRQPKRKSQLLRHGQTFFRSIKSDLGTFRTYPHAFAPKDFPTPEHVAAAIMRRLVEEARKKLPGCDLRGSHVVVTVPASLSAVAREHTLEAARLAGLDRELVELVDEPVAALLDFVNDGRAVALVLWLADSLGLSPSSEPGELEVPAANLARFSCDFRPPEDADQLVRVSVTCRGWQRNGKSLIPTRVSRCTN